MARQQRRIKKHLTAVLVGIAVVAVEARAFTTLMGWANRASTEVADPNFLISIVAIALTPAIGVVVAWYLEKT